jgi:hypothetical protein
LAQALILDAEAVNALARARERGALAHRARAILSLAHEMRALVRVPAPVLAEVCRGAPYDAAIHRLLNATGIGVLNLDRQISERAGALLASAGLTSVHAVDAFVVSSALAFDRACIATADAKDIATLARKHRSVTVFAI